MARTLVELSNTAQRYAGNGQWGAYRNARYEAAESMRRQGNWARAGHIYVEVLIFDLQGVTSTPGASAFSRAYRVATPAVVRELARFSLREKMKEEDLKQVYARVVDQFWRDAFPRSRSEIWQEVREVVWRFRAKLRLDRKVQHLGSDELLTDKEAEVFMELKDDYAIIQRVEDILEDERPLCIPEEKRDRAHKYLAAVDIEEVANRWQAKAYRRAGEVMLSRNILPKALEYFEKSLEVVDPDERVAVEQMVKKLRRVLQE